MQNPMKHAFSVWYIIKEAMQWGHVHDSQMETMVLNIIEVRLFYGRYALPRARMNSFQKLHYITVG